VCDKDYQKQKHVKLVDGIKDTNKIIKWRNTDGKKL